MLHYHFYYINLKVTDFRFEFPRPSIASQQPELMQSSFAAPGFATPSFVDPTHSQPPPAHQRIGLLLIRGNLEHAISYIRCFCCRKEKREGLSQKIDNNLIIQ